MGRFRPGGLAASQDSINRVMMRVMPGDLSSVSRDVYGALGVLAPKMHRLP